MPMLEIISKVNGTVVESTNSNTILLKENSVIKINIPFEDVANFKREGDAAVITLKSGEKITIESFFDDAKDSHHIIFEDNGKLYWAEFTDAANNIAPTIKYHAIESIEALIAAESTSGVGAALPWALGIAGLGGIIAALDDNDSSTITDSTSESNSDSTSESNSDSISESNSDSTSESNSISESNSDSTSESNSTSDSNSDSTSESNSTSDSTSTSDSDSTSTSDSDSISDSVDLNSVEDLVAAAEAAYAAADTALANAIADNAVSQAEVDALTQNLADATAAKDAAQAAVDSILEDFPTEAGEFQDRLDGLTDIVIPEVNDADGNGIDDAIDAAEAAVQAAEDAYVAAEEAIAAADTDNDGLITPAEQQTVQDAIDAAETLKDTATGLVDALPAGTDKDGLDARLDALTPLTAPAVTDADITAVDDLAFAEQSINVEEDNLNGVSGGSFALANVGAIGNLISLSLLPSSSSLNFSVAPNSTQDIFVNATGNTGSISVTAVGGALDGLINALLSGGSYSGSADLLVINRNTGEVVAIAPNSVTLTPKLIDITNLGVITTAISANNVSFTDLPPGDYTVALSTSETSGLVATLLGLIAETGVLPSSTLTIADSVLKTGDVSTGNVLTNDVVDGEISSPATVVVANVVTELGTSAAVIAGVPTIIQGAYGELTINSDGSYSYQPNTLGSSVAKVDTFTYTMSNGTYTDTALLNIRITKAGVTIDWDPADDTADGVIPEDILAADDLVTALAKNVEDNLNGTTGGSFALANVGLLGSSINLNLLPGGNILQFNVQDNSAQDITVAVNGNTGLLDLSAITGLLGGIYYADLNVINLDTGEIAAVAEKAVVFTPALLTTTINAANVQFHDLPPGNYTVAIGAPSGQGALSQLINIIIQGGVLGSSNITISESTLHDFGRVTGNVVLNDDLVAESHGGTAVVSLIASEIGSLLPVTATGTSITGQYGKLTIKADGSFEYVGNSNPSSYGKVDSFTYTINDGYHTETAVLNIRIDADGVGIVWDDANPEQDGTLPNFDAVDDVSTLEIDVRNVVNDAVVVPVSVNGTVVTTFTDTTPNFLGSYTRTYTNTFNGSQSFSVDPDTSVIGTASINVSLVDGALLQSIQWGNVIATYTITGPSGQVSSGTLVRDNNAFSSTYNDYLATPNLANLAEGTYTISYNIVNVTTITGGGVAGTPYNNGAFTVNPAIVTVDETLLTVYEPVVPGTYSVAGDILENDTVSAFAKLEIVKGANTYLIENGHISINGNIQNATSVNIVGDYGTLTLNKDGTYTYTASTTTNVWGNTEEFTYTLTDITGQTDTANLSIQITNDTNNVVNGTDLSDTLNGTSAIDLIFAGSGDDVINAGAGNDIITAGFGADSMIYDLLSSVGNGGNGLDTWTDYSKAEGDVIDISALLAGQTVDSSNIGTFVTLAQNGTDTIVSIDLDGAGTQYNPTELVMLQNTDSTTLLLDELLKYNNPI